MKKTLILGIGSVVRGDDAVGVRVAEEMEKSSLPEAVAVEYGDISGLNVIKYFSDFERIIIIDASDMSEAPGPVRVFKSGEIKKAKFKDVLSTHGMTLLETLSLSDKLQLPAEIFVIGIQPEDISYRLDMTRTLKKSIFQAVERIKSLISIDLSSTRE